MSESENEERKNGIAGHEKRLPESQNVSLETDNKNMLTYLEKLNLQCYKKRQNVWGKE